MGAYRLAKRLSSSLLADAWAGTTVTGRPIVAHVRRGPWAKTSASALTGRLLPFVRGWQGLRQPGLVPLIEAGLADGSPWVVEELLEGEPLRALLNAALKQQAPLAAPEALAIAAQVARGLLTLSRQLPPLHHGDVCASTIVVGHDGEVALGLIGLAAAQEGDATLGPARAELFTLAPDELSAPGGPRVDVFRLGLVLLELMTGKTLFAGTTHAEVVARVEKYPGLSAARLPMLPPPIAALVAAMLARSPEERPSIAEVEAALAKSLGAGSMEAHAIVAATFARLFKGRAPLLKSLEGGESLVLTALSATATSAPGLAPVAIGATNADGAVTLAKVSTRRMTGDEMAAVRAAEVAEAARVAALEWHGLHAGDDGNPKDFALGQVLLEKQLLTLAQADAALTQAQSFGSTLFSALCFLGHLDEDLGLPFAAELLRQRYLTGPQLLELGLTTANAPLLPRETAEQWQVVPLKSEAGGLLVAIADPARLDVLDEVKLRAKARSVSAVRATERTLLEGLARVYDGKTEPPEWARKKPAQVAALDPTSLPPLDASALPPRDELPALDGYSLPPLDDLDLPPPPMMSPPTEPRPLPPVPSAPAPARAPMSSPPMARPLPAAPSGFPVHDVASRLFDAVLSLVPERGPEASRLLGFVRATAKQSGATGAPLEQVSLYATGLVVAALLEGRRPFETPSLPAVTAVLGAHWRDAEPLLRPLLDGDLPTDPRAVVLTLCFLVAANTGAVPATLAQAAPALQALRPRYPAAALAAVEAVLPR